MPNIKETRRERHEESTRVSPPLKRLMITKSIRIREELVARMEEALWNHKFDGIPHGRQAEFFDSAVTHELDRLEGKCIEQAIDYLSDLYAELGKAGRVNSNELSEIDKAIDILKQILLKRAVDEAYKHATI